MIADILDVWILGSVAGNRDLPHMHLLPCLIVSKVNARTPLPFGWGVPLL